MTGTEPQATEPAQQPQTAEPQPAQQEPATQATEPAQQPQTPPPGSTVSAHKHQRDIEKLEKERDAAKAEAEGYKGLQAQFDQWKAEQAAKDTEAALKGAGCIDTVAAAARLGEFDGDVAELKKAAPYLFASSDRSKSTGGNPVGTPDPEDERTRKMRSLMGLDTDKE